MEQEIINRISELENKMKSLNSSSTIPFSTEIAFKERFSKEYPLITLGIAAPTAINVPTKAGDIYVDYVNSKIYMSIANTAYTDYKILN